MRGTLLLVGLSGADWALLEPLRQARQLPHLNALIERGAAGNLRTLQPQLPAMQWTSLAAGVGPTHHDIWDFLQVQDEQVRPLHSTQRQRPTFWQILASAGIDTQVINWPAAHPADPAGVMISEQFAPLIGPLEHPEPPPPGSVYPTELREALLPLRHHGANISLDEIRTLIPGLEKHREDIRAALLASRLAETLTVHAVARWLLQHRPARVLAVCYDLLDALAPLFIHFHGVDAPDHPYPGVISALCQRLDSMLGELCELAGPDATVILVSAHGTRQGAALPPPDSSRASGRWAQDPGMALLAGPTIAPGRALWGADIRDVTPTLLTLLDVPLDSFMEGRPWLEAFANPPTSLPPRRDWREATLPQRVSLPDVQQDAAILARLAMTGRISAQLPEAAVLRERQAMHQALGWLEISRPRPALSLLEWLHHQHPEERRYRVHLARCRLALENFNGARELLDGLIQEGDKHPRNFLLLSRALQGLNEPNQALVVLFRAEQANPREPGLHCQIGETYLSMQRWEEAERGFTRALDLAPGMARALTGLAGARLGVEDYPGTVDAALDAVSRNRHLPEAHLRLGIALHRLGDLQQAHTALATAVRMAPRLEEAHQAMLSLLEESNGDPTQIEFHRHRLARLAMLKAQRQLRQQLGQRD